MKRLLWMLSTGLAPVLLLAVMAWIAQPAPAARAETPRVMAATLTAHGEHSGTVNTAAIAVQFDDRRGIVRWVDFSEPISGLTALKTSGLDVTIAESSFGPVVCAIEGVGCPIDNCFCNTDFYWSYNFWDGADWQSYPVGASSSEISQTGAVEGWLWGEFGMAQAPAEQTLAAANALEYLRAQQSTTTGGFGDSTGAAIEVLMALGANHEHANAWQPTDGLRSLEEYLRGRATRFSRDNVAAAGKLAIASAAADACRTVRSVKPSFYFSETLGAYSPDAGFNAWGVLGAAAAGEEIPAAAIGALRSSQQENGGWEWQAGFGADTNTTSVAIQALIASGTPVTATEITGALAFLKSAQVETGGFVYDPKTPEYGADANSTAYVIQALRAAGEDPAGDAWAIDGLTPIRFLLGLQLADGSFEWQANTGSNLLATAQAVPALLGHAYPITVHEPESCVARRLRVEREAAECEPPSPGSTGGNCPGVPGAGATSETQP